MERRKAICLSCAREHAESCWHGVLYLLVVRLPAAACCRMHPYGVGTCSLFLAPLDCKDHIYVALCQRNAFCIVRVAMSCCTACCRWSDWGGMVGCCGLQVVGCGC